MKAFTDVLLGSLIGWVIILTFSLKDAREHIVKLEALQFKTDLEIKSIYKGEGNLLELINIIQNRRQK
jgi:hypothetical protein